MNRTSIFLLVTLLIALPVSAKNAKELITTPKSATMELGVRTPQYGRVVTPINQQQKRYQKNYRCGNKADPFLYTRPFNDGIDLVRLTQAYINGEKDVCKN